MRRRAGHLRAVPGDAWVFGQKWPVWELKRPARGRLYSARERRKRRLRGGEAAFPALANVQISQAQAGREAEGRRGEKVGEEAEIHLNNPEKKPPHLSCVLQRGSGAKVSPAPGVWGTESKSRGISTDGSATGTTSFSGARTG